jgi:hypothetical protein
MANARFSVRLLALVSLILLAVGTAGSGQEAVAPRREAPWAQILGRPQGEWAYLRKRQWFEDLDQARAIAKEENRPLFVVMRCLAAQVNADFDARVRAAGGELAEILPRFVNVRLAMIHDVDLGRLPVADHQDLDRTWWAWFLSPEGRVYGVYGGSMDQANPASVSIEALGRAMKRVLDHHYDPRRLAWDVDGPVFEAGEEPRTPYDLPGWKAWSRRYVDKSNPSCLRCHEVAQILRQPLVDRGRFDKREGLEVWPLLRNIGIAVRKEDCLRVLSVDPRGPAAKAGIHPGDLLGAAAGRRLFSHTDLRGVLHRLPRQADGIRIHWTRNGKLQDGTLDLRPGWRRTPVAWRPSFVWGNVGAHPGFDRAGKVSAKERARMGIAADKMAVRPIFTSADPTYLQRAGLLATHTIVAVNGESPDLSGPAFMAWFRLQFDPGDDVRLSVRAGLAPDIIEITYKVRAFPR